MSGGQIIGFVITLFGVANFFYIATRLRKDIRDGDQLFVWFGFMALIASLGMMTIIIFFWMLDDTNLAIGA